MEGSAYTERTMDLTEALMARHACHAFKFTHALFCMAKAQRTRDMIIHRIVNRFGQTAIERQSIALHVHDGPRP